ncbi:MAG: 1-acyl-sn-glycerol-3-phosphate acyltransferase [Flavobacteriales bacterium]|nr:1-acyl-sn-glycerol-3-phosphate acyltransferase [Flavobacteriales bacterium]
MKLLHNFLQLIWRIWFASIVFFGLVVFFPFLWLLLLNKKWYGHFHLLCKTWSRFILFCSGFRLEVEYEEPLDPNKAYIICPNHVSYIDIPLTFAIMPGVFVFVGKKSLSKIPVFGWVYKKTMILVDRSSNRSSYKAYKHASDRIENGIGIAIYPEGGIPEVDTRLHRFKSGAFRLALEQQVDLVPVTFLDNKKRFPCGYFGGSPGKLRVCVHKPIASKSYSVEHIKEFKKDVYNIINKKLTDYESR